MSTPEPTPAPTPAPEPAPPADPEEIDLEGLVSEMVDDKLKGLTQPAPAVKAPEGPPPAAPSEPKPTDAGVVESTVQKILADKEHATEHERLTQMGDRPPRQARKGIARAIFGE